MPPKPQNRCPSEDSEVLGSDQDHSPALIQLTTLKHLVIKERAFTQLITQGVSVPLLTGRMCWQGMRSWPSRVWGL